MSKYSIKELEEAINKLTNKENEIYEDIMKGEFLPIDPSILNNEEEIVWNFKKDMMLREDCPSKYLIEIMVNTQSRDSHFKDVVAYTILKKNFTIGPWGQIKRRMWITDEISGQLNYKVEISSIEVRKRSKLWKG